MTESVIYRCSWERRLIEGDLGMEGDLCPFCLSGHLTTIARGGRKEVNGSEIRGTESQGSSCLAGS